MADLTRDKVSEQGGRFYVPASLLPQVAATPGIGLALRIYIENFGQKTTGGYYLRVADPGLSPLSVARLRELAR